MLPTLAIGPWHVNTYVLFYAVAFAVASAVGLGRLHRAGYSPAWAAGWLGVVYLAGIAGAVVFYGAVVRLTGGSSALAHSGSSIFGGLLLGALAGWAYARAAGESPGRVFDAYVVAVPLGQAVGRLGCLLAGCCHGKPSDSWLAIDLPDAHGVWQPRYPTQLLAAAGNVAILFLLLAAERWRRRRGRGDEWPFAGFLTLLFGGVYAGKRLLVEFLRDDPPVVWPPFTWAHLTAAAVVVAAAGLVAWNWAAARRRARRGDG